jgi:hypothetical protein
MSKGLSERDLYPTVAVDPFMLKIDSSKAGLVIELKDKLQPSFRKIVRTESVSLKPLAAAG